MTYEIINSGSDGNCIIVEEIWKPVEDFKNKYEISNFGRIRNIITNNILKMTNKNGDYLTLVLYDEKHKRTTRIHRLVAQAFIPNPNNYPVVNHINGNKQDNRVENLEWCTYSHNTKEAIKQNKNIILGITKYNKNKFSNKYGRIYQFDKNNNLIDIYNNLQNASDKTNTCKRNILQVINHQQGRKQANGFIWKCEKEVMNNDL